MRSSAIGSRALPLLFFYLPSILAPAITCLANSEGITKPRTKEEAPARIAPPVRMKRKLSPANVKALPAGARAQFPPYDGDPFYITLPPSQQPTITAESVRDTLIAAILKSIGFPRGIEVLALPPDQAMKLPRANFKLLMRAAAHEYGVNKELPPDEPEMQELMLGRSKAEGEKDRAFKSAEGVGFDQYTADLEHIALQYVFRQVDGGVPIEHMAVLASGPEGKGITTIQGAVLNDYRVANRKSLSLDKAVQAAIRRLGSVSGIKKVTSQRSEEEPILVLLPYGSDSAGVTQLRYAYRMILHAVSAGQEGRFLLWLDAENQRILELDPLFAETAATGIVYNRDPGVGTIARDFEVDPTSGGQYTLQLTGVMNRVQYAPNAALDVSISDSTNGSNGALANFDQSPINDATQALCASGTNKSFQQVNFFGTIYRYYQTVLGHGIFTPFPASPWSPQVEVPNYCNANSAMVYGACQGYFDAACPNFPGAFMNFAHDNTVVGHELAHSITPRLTNARPANWCGTPSCPMPVGWWQLHDLADFWADHFESTNCTAGWVAKNLNGANANLNCAIHDEDGGLPRKHEVTVPFNPGAPGEHFPEHRAISVDGGGYSDGQIGAAALWQVRLGMGRRSGVAGILKFGVRFQEALTKTGFFGSYTPAPPPATDTDIHRMLYDLEWQMVNEWATSFSGGDPTTSKVTAGFARAGIFLIPYQCLDGDPATSDPHFCPSGESGADAVIDVDRDFVRRGGKPTFLVWTGPRFRLSGPSGAFTLNNPSPCNTRFSVEVSDQPDFPSDSTLTSPWINVDTNPGTPGTPQCYGTWTPADEDWTNLVVFSTEDSCADELEACLSLVGKPGGWTKAQCVREYRHCLRRPPPRLRPRLYYRARTQDAAGGNERLSTMPENGIWTIPPPFVLIR